MPQERWATLKREHPKFDPADRFLFGKARERSAAALCCRPLGTLLRYDDSDMYSITESRKEPPFRAEEMPYDLSYWEALRAYWRYYWPPQALVLSSLSLVKLFPALALVLAVPVVVIAFFGGWLFVSRLYSRPYRGFSLVVVETPAEVDVLRLTLGG